MLKLSDELKSIPNWFENFSKEKLYENQVPMIRYLIWLMQASSLYSMLNALRMMSQVNSLVGFAGAAYGAPAILSFLLISLVTIPLTQITILGIQAKSKLAWLLLVTSALSTLFSMAFPIGVLMLVFLNQDEVIDYFKSENNAMVKA